MKKTKKSHKKVFIYGTHALMEALEHKPDVIGKVFIDKNKAENELLAALKRADIKPGTLGSEKKAKRIQDQENHQGVIAQVKVEKLMVPFKEFVNDLQVSNDTSLLILNEIQDPHNVGAVIRSAAAFGVSGVLIPEHNQAPVTGAVIKVSAGMAFRVPLVASGNINQAIHTLKDKGFWVYGLDGDGTTRTNTENFERPSAFVLGNEATGLREQTHALCDDILSIPINPQCESLNAATAAAIALYAWSNQHPDALK